ncbi:MAG: phosphopantothenoylcysteine decarboxylase [Candidatus Omnitrophica bacterium]|nr:phosphopantothenoylcysteine decarboxylase [Candidatus Omnitrophota bacterium]
MKPRRRRSYRLLITAGPTREPIDPVRFISNYSTGTLGYALARMARARGHQVTLISGPTELVAPRGVRKIDVETAGEMEQAVVKTFPKADGLIMGAAVADFRPIRVATQKIKRSGVAGSLRLWQLELVENPDIVARVARQRRGSQAIIGFALETESLLANARRKLKSKDLDAIVATQLSPRGKGRGPFGTDPVDGAILDREGRTKSFRSLAKSRLAARILDTVEETLASRAKE